MELIKQDQYRYRLPRSGGMLSDGLIFADRSLITGMDQDTLAQVAGMASLPGLVGPALAMPDAHLGYGFPIGGVAAYDMDGGVISPGGVGYDINCGVRLLRTKLEAGELAPDKLRDLADLLASRVSAGVGSSGPKTLSSGELNAILQQGAAWAVSKGSGSGGDLEYCENQGRLQGAEPAALGDFAKERGRNQVGSLGAGNHFLELAQVAEIFDEPAARAFGLHLGQLVVWIHCGSRGLGAQVCDDYLKRLKKSKDAIRGKDPKLISAPLDSGVGRDYLGAMLAAGNYAFANRQALTQQVRELMQQFFKTSPAGLGMGLVYDVTHNLARAEKHPVGGKTRELMVHRKGATRALGPGHDELPASYRSIGQPVLLPGDMGRASYVLRGTAQGAESFASSAHGAGRRLRPGQGQKTGQRAQNRGRDGPSAGSGAGPFSQNPGRGDARGL